jgi:hypothetical protein
MTVPESPSGRGGSAAFWFGIQTEKGDGALIQPIMSKWLGNSFYMFQEIFDWTDQRDKQTTPIKVSAGDVISASVSCAGSACQRYLMNMTNINNKQTSNYYYDLLPRQSSVESAAYFVLEHQPLSCRELPSNNNVTWTNILVEVDGKNVESPMWRALEEEPKCSSKAVVVDPATVSITWSS